MLLSPFRQHHSTGSLRQRSRCSRLQLRVQCKADITGFGKFGDKNYLNKAAQRFRIGLENGVSEDELVAWELGATNREELTEVQRAYVDKVKERLLQRVEQIKVEETERRKREAKYLELGKKAYEFGEYPTSVEYLERAVEDCGRDTSFGGEALMWLALAYQACGREQDCIDTYKWLEENHPIKKIQKQAADLRYIMEAPKLEIGPDERVQIPLLDSEEAWKRNGRRSYTPKYNAPAPKKETTYWDRLNWEMPEQFIPDKWYVRLAWALLLLGVAVYFNWQVLVTRATGG